MRGLSAEKVKWKTLRWEERVRFRSMFEGERRAKGESRKRGRRGRKGRRGTKDALGNLLRPRMQINSSRLNTTRERPMLPLDLDRRVRNLRVEDKKRADVDGRGEEELVEGDEGDGGAGEKAGSRKGGFVGEAHEVTAENFAMNISFLRMHQRRCLNLCVGHEDDVFGRRGCAVCCDSVVVARRRVRQRCGQSRRR